MGPSLFSDSTAGRLGLEWSEPLSGLHKFPWRDFSTFLKNQCLLEATSSLILEYRVIRVSYSRPRILAFECAYQVFGLGFPSIKRILRVVRLLVSLI